MNREYLDQDMVPMAFAWLDRVADAFERGIVVPNPSLDLERYDTVNLRLEMLAFHVVPLLLGEPRAIRQSGNACGFSRLEVLDD